MQPPPPVPTKPAHLSPRTSGGPGARGVPPPRPPPPGALPPPPDASALPPPPVVRRGGGGGARAVLPPPPPPETLPPPPPVVTVAGSEEEEWQPEVFDPSSKRPVPLPPGTVKEDFSFLFANGQAPPERLTDRVRAASRTDKKRMSIMLNQKIVPPSPRASLSDIDVSLESPKSSARDSPSSATGTGRVGSKTELFARIIERLESVARPSWTSLSVSPDVTGRFKAMLSSRSDWSYVEALRDHCELLHAARILIQSFSPHVLFTSVLAQHFVNVAALRDTTRRQMSYYSLLSALPSQHRVLLEPLCLVLSKLNDKQLEMASMLFSDVFENSEKLVKTLVRDLPSVKGGRFLEEHLAFDSETQRVSAASIKGLMIVLFDPHYELIEPEWIELVTVTMPYFVKTDVEMIELVHERYSELLVAEDQKEKPTLLARKRLLMFVHQWLMEKKGGFSDTFGEHLSAFKMILHETDSDTGAMVHVEFILRFHGILASNIPMQTPDLSTASPSLAVLSFGVDDWCAALTQAAYQVFMTVTPVDSVCKNWSGQSLPYKRLTNMFNNLQLFVATAILRPEDRAQQMIHLEHFVSVAHALVSMRNFHAAFAVYAGLSMTCVSRLKALWAGVPAKVQTKFEELQTLFNPSKNHLSYQQALDKGIGKLPGVPNMVMFLKWLFAIEDANKDFLDNGLINFSKLRLVFAIVQKISALQASPSYDGITERVSDELVAFCTCIPAAALMQEEPLYQLSLVREPRGTGEAVRKLSLKDTVRGAMIRARTNTLTGTRKSSASPESTGTLRSSQRKGSHTQTTTLSRGSSPGVLSSVASGPSSSPASPRSTVVRGMVCPLCVQGFPSKEELVEHVSNCKGKQS